MSGTNVCSTPKNCDHHPVVCVDFCDAKAYCSFIGKRLCGLIGGEQVDWNSDLADVTKSQWYRACSSGQGYAYPYGNTPSDANCNGREYWAPTYSYTTTEVGKLSTCTSSTSGFGGVYDLSGNVREFEDGVHSVWSSYYYVRGGAFSNETNAIQCDDSYTFYATGNLDHTANDTGFRCCSDNP